jgi:hypothetical protein
MEFTANPEIPLSDWRRLIQAVIQRLNSRLFLVDKVDS